MIGSISSLVDLPSPEQSSGRGGCKSHLFSPEDLDRRVLGLQVRWLVAGTLELVSFITAIGAGMTVKFFPLFFRIDYHFTPAELCLLSCAYPLSIAAMVQVCQRVSKRHGRLHIVLL